MRDRLTAGRLALDQEVGVRIPVPQPSIESTSVVFEGYARNRLSKHFVTRSAVARARFVYGDPHRVTRAAPLGRAAPLSSTRRFDPESPIRWLVRAHFGDTGLCGSERGELADVGRTASNGESGATGSLLAGAPRAASSLRRGSTARSSVSSRTTARCSAPRNIERSRTPRCGAPGCVSPA